jgi:hypothetical protein
MRIKVIKFPDKQLSHDAKCMYWDIDNKAISLGMFWGTMYPSNKKENFDEKTRKAYDKKIKELYCDFSRTILIADKDGFNSDTWKMLVRNAKTQLKWEKK